MTRRQCDKKVALCRWKFAYARGIVRTAPVPEPFRAMHRVLPDGTPVSFLPSDWAQSVLAGPYVEPPYRGALEDELAWHLVKVLPETARLRSEHQVEIATATGPAVYTLDFVIELRPDNAPGARPRRIAIELSESRTVASGGGLRDHDLRLRRDATLLAAGAVDTVYRLRGSDLMGAMDDVLFLASVWDPSLFSERGRINLCRLASPEARGLSLRPEQPSVLVPYAVDGEATPERALWHIANGHLPHVYLRRLDRRFPDVWRPYAAPLAEPEVALPVVPLRRAA